MRISLSVSIVLCIFFASFQNAFSQEDEAGKTGKIAPEYQKEIVQLAQNKQIHELTPLSKQQCLSFSITSKMPVWSNQK